MPQRFDPTDGRDAHDDFDGDLIPNRIEMEVTGGEFFLANSDSDDLDDLLEWFLGTDPVDGNDPAAEDGGNAGGGNGGGGPVTIPDEGTLLASVDAGMMSFSFANGAVQAMQLEEGSTVGAGVLSPTEQANFDSGLEMLRQEQAFSEDTLMLVWGGGVGWKAGYYSAEFDEQIESGFSAFQFRKSLAAHWIEAAMPEEALPKAKSEVWGKPGGFDLLFGSLQVTRHLLENWHTLEFAASVPYSEWGIRPLPGGGLEISSWQVETETGEPTDAILNSVVVTPLVPMVMVTKEELSRGILGVEGLSRSIPHMVEPAPGQMVRLLPVEVAPDVLRANTDVDEGRIDSGTGWVIPDSMDDQVSLVAEKDSPNGAVFAGDVVTDDLHEGFFGVRPSTLEPEFFDSATVEIKKLEKRDSETGWPEIGQIRFHATWGDDPKNLSWKAIEAYDFESLQPNNLVGSLYGSSAQIPNDATLWIEGVVPGKITLEFSLKKGDVEVKHEQTFEVCTPQSRGEWFEEVVALTKLQTQNDPSGEIDLDAFVASTFDGGFVSHREQLFEAYDYYQQLFLQEIRHADSTEAFAWYGLARLVTATVVAGMADSQFAIDNVDLLTDPAENPNPDLVLALPDWVDAHAMVLDLFGDFSEDQIRRVQIALLAGARDIFDDMGYQGRAYQGSGLCALEHLFNVEGELFAFDGWQLIEAGIREGDDSLIEDGAHLLTFREQREIVVPGFTALREIGEDFDGLGGNPVTFAFSVLAKNAVPGGKSFSDLVAGDVTDTDDRWKWVTDADQGILDAWNDLSNANRKTEVGATLYDRAAQFHYVWFGLSRYALKTEDDDVP
ncbi:MAG: hypothetical protein HKN23_13155 [Verrucomicrobiales bacterium]|nr:hypothetical protein [Verrucomicrobiales bacterium]